CKNGAPSGAPCPSRAARAEEDRRTRRRDKEHGRARTPAAGKEARLWLFDFRRGVRGCGLVLPCRCGVTLDARQNNIITQTCLLIRRSRANGSARSAAR